MELLKRLHFDQPDIVLLQYSRWDYDRYCNLIEINNLIKNDTTGYQHGGDPIDYTYNNYQFKVFVERTSISTDISVHPGDNQQSPKHCIHLTIHRNDDPMMKTAYLNNISYYPDCSKIGLDYPGGGSILVKFAIHLLRTIKGIDILRVRLRDTSMYRCGGKKGKMLKLALMYSMTHGETWYGKFGFRPYELDDMKETKNLLSMYENNIKIANLKIIDRFDLMKKYFGKKLSDAEFREKAGNWKIGRYIEYYVKSYDRNCEWFSQNYIKLAKELRIFDFSHKSFEMVF